MLRQIASAVVSHQLDVSHRRLFVKTLITFLDVRRTSLEGETRLTKGQALAAVRSTYEILQAAEDEAEFRDF